ncbi:uracil-DNA glycosylase family protein [Gemmatimonadota bacterium DH-20]|uniref:Uracil-DNA glycosylase family protein n=1 Tax=Gaopeijia maritima TaxID=3119007 RepID=A0ABU9EDD0_9BACT
MTRAPSPGPRPDHPIAEAFVAASRRLCEAVEPLRFAEPVTHVYNPLVYARAMHEAYLRRAAPRTEGGVLLLGMNPGPWGMVQTGVPFGEIAAVRDWMRLVGEVDKPEREHPKRPVEGLACTRSEVSGRRLWGLLAERFGTFDAFAERHVVVNYCPLVFMEASGRNRTPNKLPAEERAPLEAACDRHLAELIEAARPAWLIGVGAFAEGCLERVRTEMGADGGSVEGDGGADRAFARPRIGRVLHPSPASPAANRGWAEQAVAQMEAQGVW